MDPMADRPVRMPLSQWKLANFKSIVAADLELRALNVVVGANSSGKSSLLQSILLFVQAAQGIGRSDSIPLNGPLVNLGGFPDVVTAGAEEGTTVIGGTMALEPRIESGYQPPRMWFWPFGPFKVSWEITLQGKAENQPGAAKIASVSMSAEVLRGTSPTPVKITIEGRSRVPDPAEMDAFLEGQHLRPLRGASNAFHGFFDAGAGIHERIEGIVLRGGIPTELLVEAQDSQILAQQWADAAIGRLPRRRTQVKDAASPSSVAPLLSKVAEVAAQQIKSDAQSSEAPALSKGQAGSLDPELRRALRDVLKSGAVDREVIRDAIAKQLPSKRIFVDRDVVHEFDDSVYHFHAASEMAAAFFGNTVYYLGPLRQDPQVIYRATNVLSPSPGFVGAKGEYAPFVLHSFGHMEIECPLREGGFKQATLRDAVNYWLGEHGVAERIAPRDMDTLALGLDVHQPGVNRTLDLTSVGVGVSQLLPVVVMALGADPGSLLLFEQPELHLHPAVQQRLGDFFLAITSSGRQVIVETHSEYLIDRLRLRIAEDESDHVIGLITFIYAQLEGGRTRFDQVVPNEYGSIERWPAGFFDQTPSEAASILRAAVDKRKHRQTSGQAMRSSIVREAQ